MAEATTIDTSPHRSQTPRRLVFAGIGLVQGFAVFAITSAWGEGWPEAARQGAVLFVVLAPPIWYLCHDRTRPVDAAAFAVALAAVVAGLDGWMARRTGLPANGFNAVVVLGYVLGAILGCVSLPFFQCWQRSREFRFPYPALFGHAWANCLTLAAAAGFVGALWLLLWLWASLFRLVEIEFFSDVFGSAPFAMPATGLAAGLGVALLREHEGLIRSLQTLAFALKMALAPVLPVAAVLFLLFLPFAGLDTLWRTGHATAILLLVVAVGVLLANAVTRESRADRIASAVVVWPVTVHVAVMPIFTALAFYATGLRVAQHGLTPDRFYAAMLIFVAGLYAVVYAYAVFRRRVEWDESVRHYNPALAVIVAALALLLLTPAGDAYRLSAWDQSRRLTSGRVDPAAFDFGYLRYELGAPGREALARLRDDPGAADGETVRRRLALLDASEDYRRWKDALRRDQRLRSVEDFGLLHDYLVVTPETRKIPAAFEEFLRRHEPALLQWCYAKPVERCALVIADLVGGDAPEVVVVRRWTNANIAFEAYLDDGEKGWRVYDRWTAFNREGGEIWRRIKSGQVEVVAPKHKVLRIGEVTVPLAPRQ